MKLEIVSYKNGNVVKEINVFGKSESQIDKIDRGLNINLNHDEFYTRLNETTH